MSEWDTTESSQRRREKMDSDFRQMLRDMNRKAFEFAKMVSERQMRNFRRVWDRKE
jgi:hypothetical protein